MTVYVDRLRQVSQDRVRCRVWADTKKELRTVEEALDLDPSWRRNHPYPHYELSPYLMQQIKGAAKVDRYGWEEYLARKNDDRNKLKQWRSRVPRT